MLKLKETFWEIITWSSVIVATFVVVSFFPWYIAEGLLRYVLVVSGVAAIFWYLKSRRLYHEGRSKTKKIREKQSEITESQKTFDLIFEHAADGILILDCEQKIVSFSPGLERITGFSKEDMVGRAVKETLQFKGDSDNSLLPDVMFLPHALKKAPYIKNTLVTREGREIDIEASCTLIQRSTHDKPQALAIIRDTTYENELARRDKEFIAVTSHQLNTPLSIINGFANLLKDQKAGKTTEKQTEYVSEIIAATQKMISLTNNLLSISRIEQDKIKLEKTDINAHDLIKELEKNYRMSAHKNLQIHFDIPDKSTILYGDQSKIQQALSNIIDNAIKYTTKGTVKITVVSKGSGIQFIIKDTGIGIKADDLAKIGEKFYRSQEAINIDNHGTGLGLFIAKTIIEKHGGNMTVDSEIGKGTTFTISLPKRLEQQ